MNDETGRDLVPHEGKLDLTTIKLTPTGGMEITNAGQLLDMAKAMSKADIAVRKHLRGNPGACLGVLMQAMNWQMQPFLVASKSFLVNEQLGFEAQLLHAVVLKRAPIKGRPKIEFLGEGPDRQVRVSAKLEDDEVVEYVSPPVKSINPKNSPLWVNDTDQQLSYYGVRGLARRHFPDVLMGAYAVDEMERTPYQGEMKGFNPLAAPHDGETIEGGVSVTPAAGQTIEHDPETGEIEPANAPPPKPKRHRRTKAEIEAERAAEPQEPGDLVPATVPEPASADLPLMDRLQIDLSRAINLAAWASVLEAYKPAYDDMKETAPEMALEMARLGNERRAQILAAHDQQFEQDKQPAQDAPQKGEVERGIDRALELGRQDAPQEAQEPAAAEPATQVAPEPETPAEPSPPAGEQATQNYPWPNGLEVMVAKWEHLPEVRELCLFLWAASDAEDADNRYALIQTRRSAEAMPDPLARRVVRLVLGAVREKFGEPS